jgi:hypothetical protein
MKGNGGTVRVLVPAEEASAVMRILGAAQALKNPPTDREKNLCLRVVQIEDLLAACNETIRQLQARIAEFEACFSVAPGDDGGEIVEVDNDKLLELMYGPAEPVLQAEEPAG